MRKKRSFLSLFWVRLAVLLVATGVLASGIYWIIRNDTFHSNDADEMFGQEMMKTFSDKAAYEKGGTRYKPLATGTGKHQWLAAIKSYDRIMPVALGEDGYWGVYDYKNDTVLAEYSDNCFTIGLTFRDNGEKKTEYSYVLAEEQMDIFMPLMKNTGAERLSSDVYITCGYVKGNRFMIEKYRIGVTGKDVTLPCENADRWEHFVLEIVDHPEAEDKEYNRETYWAGPHQMYGVLHGYEIASPGCLINASSYATAFDDEETPVSGKIDENVKKEAKKRLDECVQQYWGDGDGYTFKEGSASTGTVHEGALATDRIWMVDSFCDGENIYGFVYTVNWDSKELRTIFWELMLAAGMLSLVGAVLWANVSYTRYKIQREMFAYRTMVTNTMAHDLKSPLMAISGYVENIMENTNPEKNEHYLKEISKKTVYMNHLIENTLELAESEEMVVEKKSSLELRDCISEILDDFADRVEEKKLSVMVDGRKQVECDANAMRIALRNVVENAVKYAEENGKIVILLQEKAIVVKNTSRPVEMDGDKLFEAFVKDDASRTGAKGNGLGLAIVKSICEAHGYTPTADYDEGMFTLTIQF